MKELEKIIGTYYADNEPITRTDLFDLQSVKSIAIAYAKVCLEKAAEEATLCFSGMGNTVEETDLTGCSNDYGSYWINSKSITNIELP